MSAEGQRFTTLRSLVAPLLRDNVDTDQIIPARFLKRTDRRSLGGSAFADWATDPAFVLRLPRYQQAQVLLAGDNFGCGSSREHAAWALLGAGFRAVVAKSFGDIFRQNALKNGLLPVQLSPHKHEQMVQELTPFFSAKTDPEAEAASAAAMVEIDLEQLLLSTAKGLRLSFEVDAFSRHCLLGGIDELDYLLSFSAEIARYEVGHG